MSDNNETEDQLAKRMAEISAGGPKNKSYTQPLGNVSVIKVTPVYLPHPAVANLKAPIDDDKPATEEDADNFSDILGRRTEQGMEHFPFDDGIHSGFVRLGTDGKPYNPSKEEILREVAGWFVKKGFKYHAVNDLQTELVKLNVSEIIGNRIRTAFPLLKAGGNTLADLLEVLMEPNLGQNNPEFSFPVWSGRTVSLPGNTQKIVFVNGLAVVNIWETPKYRDLTVAPSVFTKENPDYFDEFLRFVIPVEQDRNMFLDWLAWQLQNENQKPKWAVMLYSQNQGTGKSVIAEVCEALFGQANATRCSVEQLLARFNKEILQHKMVIVEEVSIPKGSAKANGIKTLITDPTVTMEAKGAPSTKEPILCSFILTTNHLPTWLEESDRRFFIMNFDHEGYNNGGKEYEYFSKLGEAISEKVAKRPAAIKALHNVLLARDLSDFNPMSLNVQKYSTQIMKDLRQLSPDVVKQNLEELFENNGIHFIPQDLAVKLVKTFAKREANAVTHLFSEMGWKQKKVAWLKGTQKRCWYKQVENPPAQGDVCTGGAGSSDGAEPTWEPIWSQLERIAKVLHNEDGKDYQITVHDEVKPNSNEKLINSIKTQSRRSDNEGLPKSKGNPMEAFRTVDPLANENIDDSLVGRRNTDDDPEPWPKPASEPADMEDRDF